MKKLQLILTFLVVILSVGYNVEAKIRHYRWEVKYEFRSPYCYRMLAITVNGRTPGPTIKAQRGDTIVVDLTNRLLNESIAVHWHGIRQIGTPWADGTEGVTQCPVLPGDTFRYKFIVDRAGTYLYHAHSRMQQGAGLYGSIRVALPAGESEPFAYDYDRSIILNDWYHRSPHEQATIWVGNPQSLLIQGRGRFNCSTPGISTDSCNDTNPECSPYTFTVVPGKTYRLRIGSLTALAALSFEIEGHNMTVVEADGHYVEPFVVNNIYIYSGETYSVLITANQDPRRNYWVVTNMVGRNNTTPNGLGILNYYPNHRTRSPPTVPPSGPGWNDVEAQWNQSLAIRSHPDYIHPVPQTSDRVIILKTNVSFTTPHTPYLISLYHNVTNVGASDVNGTHSESLYRLEFNTTVDIIVQNADTLNVENIPHPMHMHGHDAWVLGYGSAEFNALEDQKRFNLVNPIMKNTVPVHQYGWTALRFVADNPGVWAFRGQFHIDMDMGVVFEESIERLPEPELPSSIMGCAEP